MKRQWQDAGISSCELTHQYLSPHQRYWGFPEEFLTAQMRIRLPQAIICTASMARKAKLHLMEHCSCAPELFQPKKQLRRGSALKARQVNPAVMKAALDWCASRWVVLVPSKYGMMGTEGCKRAVPLGILWQLHNNMRLHGLCSTNKYRYTQMNKCIYLEWYLLRSHGTKRITDGTKEHRGVPPVGLQSTPQLEVWPQEEAQRTQNSLSRESWKESALMGVGSLQDLLKLLSRRSANARIKPEQDINRLQSHLCCCQQTNIQRFPPKPHITDSPVLVLHLPNTRPFHTANKGLPSG